MGQAEGGGAAETLRAMWWEAQEEARGRAGGRGACGDEEPGVRPATSHPGGCFPTTANPEELGFVREAAMSS